MIEYSKFEHAAMVPDVIHVLGKYKPWWIHKEQGGDGSNFPNHSSKILDLKKSQESALRYFQAMLEEMIKKPAFALAVVPSHDMTKTRSGLHIVTTRLATKIGVVDGGDYLQRTVTIAKLSSGGDRSIAVHTNSLSANGAHRFAGKKIMLIDDVMTTGNSLAAGRKVLLDAGAAEVVCVAMAQTTY
jgi:predicted amidophosphoribosyltransferase